VNPAIPAPQTFNIIKLDEYIVPKKWQATLERNALYNNPQVTHFSLFLLFIDEGVCGDEAKENW
jgi:hypothetical protein